MVDVRASKIRVLVAGLEPLPKRIITQALADHVDIELRPPDGESEALAAIAEWHPDVVIVPAAAESRATAYHMALRGYPSVKVVEIRGAADVYEVRLLVANPGSEAVVEAIRTVAARTGEGDSR